MRVLLVFDECMEIKFFNIQDPTEEELAVLDLANGYYINSDAPAKNEKAVSKISDAITRESFPGLNKKWFAKKWHLNSIDSNCIHKAGAFDRVYFAGFAA